MCVREPLRVEGVDLLKFLDGRILVSTWPDVAELAIPADSGRVLLVSLFHCHLLCSQRTRILAHKWLASLTISLDDLIIW